jgi:hypothetical protein
MNHRITIVRFCRRAARRWPLLALALCSFAETKDGAPLDPALPKTPLPPPLTVTGGFGEFRIGHFHAGLDFGTKQHVGMHVMAPIDGWVERIRASGVGYGRSVYLHTNDGRLIQLGHLDAFVEPLASYVRARQDSTGQYEQDLWPAKDQFRFRAGQQIAWSGQSGSGGPHLHFEIRHGDMAYHPFRAGLAVNDNSPPSIVDLTLEPLDDASFVEGSAAPHTEALGTRPDTIRVMGRVRAIVGARDGVWSGVDRMVPWAVGMRWDGRETECRFDSISWATDMVESDYVYDSGRVIGQKGIVLWAPPGFRPRVMRTSAPRGEEAGTIVVRPGDSPRPLTLRAIDLAGHVFERTVTIVANDRAATAPAPAKNSPSEGPYQGFEFDGLPGGYVRVTQTAVPLSATDVQISSNSLHHQVPATRSPRGWCVILPEVVKNQPGRFEEFIAHATVGGQSWDRSVIGALIYTEPAESTGFNISGNGLGIPAHALFERQAVMVIASVAPSAATDELTPVGAQILVGPATTPLRGVVHFSLSWSGKNPRHLGLYRFGDDGWEWAGARVDSVTHRVDVDLRRFGRYSLFHDETAPRASLKEPPRRAPKGEYPTWAIEAAVTEHGSGLDPRASHLELDGKAVPTEWDPEAQVLRFRPAKMPSKGSHEAAAVVVDRAGNSARTTRTFVLD